MRRVVVFLSRPPWWLAALVIAAAVAITFAPALPRPFTGDQLWYLDELRGSRSLADGLRLLDYSLMRHPTGDLVLYRPLLFAWLALENWRFGYHVIWWNAANMALHTGVGLALFHLLTTIRRSAAALVVAVLFVVFTPSLYLVIWNHVGGYLIGWLCLTVALAAAVRLLWTDTGPGSRRDLWIVAAGMIAAESCHESVAPMAALLAVTLWWTERRRAGRVGISRLAPLAAPIIVFAVTYGAHLRRVAAAGLPMDVDVRAVLSVRSVVVALMESTVAAGTWLRELLVPSALHLRGEAQHKYFEFSWRDPSNVAGAALAIAALAMLAWLTTPARLRKARTLLLLLAGMTVAYATALTLGRSFVMTRVYAYYAYPFGILAVAGAYAVVDPARATGRVAAAMTAAVAALAIWHGVGTAGVVRDLARYEAPTAAYLRAIESFVDRHRAEPGFSFAIEGRPDDIDPTFVLDHADGPQPISTSEIIFRRYYRTDQARYVVNAREFMAPAR